MKRLIALAFLLATALPLSAQAPPVRVGLFWTQPQEQMELQPAESVLRLRRCPTCPWTEISGPVRLSAADNTLRLDGAAVGAGPLQVEGPHRVTAGAMAAFTLAGPTHIQARQGRLRIVTGIALEDYTAQVLAGESSNFTSIESLKAMAVAVRTFAARNRGRHQAEGFDLCDTTHCQDLRLSSIPDRLRNAASETEGELLWYEGRPAATFYHRDCGGHTEAAHEVWPGERFSYLRAQADPHCASSSARREWRANIRKTDLAAALASEGVQVPQPLQSVSVRKRTASGRTSELMLTGAGSVPARAATVRLAVGRQLGWTLLRSDLYEIRDAGDKVSFLGRGAGHGVGLCQAGAARMGEAGRRYREILSFYFPGTRVGVSAQAIAWRAAGSPRIELLTTQPREDGSVVELAERLLSEAEARFGSKVRIRPQLRVYPSVEVYRDATGQPGWMAASTRGRLVRMQPVEALRRQGALEETLRHEMMHVVVENHARRGLPLWFREGLVLLLSNGSRKDEELVDVDEVERMLRAPRDRAELNRAQAAARAHVAALVQRHGVAQVIQWVSRGIPADVRP
ncbi:MAG: SpoIID/LytB domain-containing protein [Candidatus Acidiferrales bacterium]